MKKTIYPILVLVVAGAFLAWWFSPSQVVKRKTDRLMELMSFEQGSGKAARQTGVYSLNALLAEEVELSSDSHPEMEGMRERQELESVYAWMAEHVVVSSFERVSFEKVEIRDKLAEVELTVAGVVELPGSKPVNGRYAVFLLWMKVENQWRLGHARWTKAGDGR
jgi:hypothetical protein